MLSPPHDKTQGHITTQQLLDACVAKVQDSGFDELEGIANRTDFDLKAHAEKSYTLPSSCKKSTQDSTDV